MVRKLLEVKRLRPRKKHNGEAGYIAERTNPYVPGEKVVIYVAAEQGLEDSQGKYAVVCVVHGTLCFTTSVPRARVLMKAPDNFCDDCRIARKREEEVG